MRYPKPEPRRRIKARRTRQTAKYRAACRAVALTRAGGRCERCGVGISDELPEWHPQRAHVNETIPRSRGGDPTNPEHAEAICQQCHYPNGRHAPTAARQAVLLERTR